MWGDISRGWWRCFLLGRGAMGSVVESAMMLAAGESELGSF
ncbi:hypothetical protein EC9_00400 [Rosistilla ulvae]|uniref:Uncharacterized protein n=1 Tax=Rosistilla ulvae TaxID=1930277 RepID=A0A517LTC8_9BACT|nr:hypothetical protein EC9_00400 [Rosistilla ulvae]